MLSSQDQGRGYFQFNPFSCQIAEYHHFLFSRWIEAWPLIQGCLTHQGVLQAKGGMSYLCFCVDGVEPLTVLSIPILWCGSCLVGCSVLLRAVLRGPSTLVVSCGQVQGKLALARAKQASVCSCSALWCGFKKNNRNPSCGSCVRVRFCVSLKSAMQSCAGAGSVGGHLHWCAFRAQTPGTGLPRCELLQRAH